MIMGRREFQSYNHNDLRNIILGRCTACPLYAGILYIIPLSRRWELCDEP